MKQKQIGIKNKFYNNKWFFIGAVLVFLFVFSNLLFGFKLSFTNANYIFPPFNSTGTAVSGPVFTDIADSHYPSVFRIFYSSEGFSLWDSDIALGRPIDSIAFLMNPTEWVYFLPMEFAILFKAISEFALGFFFMYLFMRAINLNKYSAALTSGIYAFSTTIVLWLGWPHSDVVAWAPLMFFAVEKLISTMKIKYMLLISLSVFIMLIAGMPTFAAYFLYLCGIYIVFYTIKTHKSNKKNIFIVGFMFAIAVVIGAIASLPYTYPLLTNTVSNGYMSSREYMSEISLDISYLRTIVFPLIRDGLGDLHINESTLYLGLAPVVLLPLAFFGNKKKSKNLFFLISSAVVLILIFTSGLDFIFTKLPMINTSLKIRVITLLMFTLSIVTGISVNDLLENKEYYKKKKWIFGILLTWAVLVFAYFSKGLIGLHTIKIACAFLFSVAIIALVAFIIYTKKLKTIAMICLISLVLLDGGFFAKSHLPWISADASIIPEPTDSVSYLIENTKNEERIVGVGASWIFLPNTPSYYNLNDIRTHGFESTNSDFKNYYQAIDAQAYASKTRINFSNISNYELLKYLGVKYFYSNADMAVEVIGENLPNSDTFGAIKNNAVISQEVTLPADIKKIQILFATYNTTPKSNGLVKLSLTQGDNIVVESSVPVKKIKDNTYLSFDIDKSIEEGNYKLNLSFGDLKDDTITLWLKSNGEMCIKAVDNQNAIFKGNDNMFIYELDEFSDKVTLAENLFVFESEDAILSKMKEGYIDNCAFVCGDYDSYNIPLEENEKAEIIEYKDDYVKINCTSNYDRYLTLNDYYANGWNAYINGDEVEIEKANYLFRCVKVSKGKDMVIEFKYENDSIFKITYLSIAVIVAAILLFIFNKKIQARLDKKIRNEENTNA